MVKYAKYGMGVMLLTVATGFLTGCANTSGTTVKINHNTGGSMLMEENVRLAHHVDVIGVSYDEVNGLQRSHITVKSRKNKRIRVDYRICWFDANGVEIDGDTKPYRHLIIEGHDQTTVTGVANSPLAVKSKMRIRETSQAD